MIPILQFYLPAELIQAGYLLQDVSITKQKSVRKQMPKMDGVHPKPNNEWPVITSLVAARRGIPWILNQSECTHRDTDSGGWSKKGGHMGNGLPRKLIIKMTHLS